MRESHIDGVVAINTVSVPVHSRAGELAERIASDANTVRSHLNRNLGARYRKEGRGWVLVGEAAS